MFSRADFSISMSCGGDTSTGSPLSKMAYPPLSCLSEVSVRNLQSINKLIFSESSGAGEVREELQLFTFYRALFLLLIAVFWDCVSCSSSNMIFNLSTFSEIHVATLIIQSCLFVYRKRAKLRKNPFESGLTLASQFAQRSSHKNLEIYSLKKFFL